MAWFLRYSFTLCDSKLLNFLTTHRADHGGTACARIFGSVLRGLEQGESGRLGEQSMQLLQVMGKDVHNSSGQGLLLGNYCCVGMAWLRERVFSIMFWHNWDYAAFYLVQKKLNTVKLLMKFYHSSWDYVSRTCKWSAGSELCLAGL